MTGSEHYASYATAGPARFGATYDEPEYDEPEPFYPGERIGTSAGAVRRRSRLPWLGITATVVVCAGAVLVEEGVTSSRQVLASGATVLNSFTNALSQSFRSATAFAPTKTAAPSRQPEHVAELPPIEDKPVAQVAVVAPTIVNDPQPEPQPQAAPDTSPKGEAEPPGKAGATVTAPLPRPVAVAPYQKRAEAVGLHPGLSRVLLTGLSKADYRNARFAITTALTKTPDDAVFVWPRKKRPKLAMFQVRFVPGAPSNCRRYIVEIAKNGWLTTARPMEKCGIKVSSLARKN